MTASECAAVGGQTIGSCLPVEGGGVCCKFSTPATTTTLQIEVKLTLLIIPVNRESSYDLYSSSADNIADHFLARIPLSECPDKFVYLKTEI